MITTDQIHVRRVGNQWICDDHEVYSTRLDLDDEGFRLLVALTIERRSTSPRTTPNTYGTSTSS